MRNVASVSRFRPYPRGGFSSLRTPADQIVVKYLRVRAIRRVVLRVCRNVDAVDAACHVVTNRTREAGRRRDDVLSLHRHVPAERIL